MDLAYLFVSEAVMLLFMLQHKWLWLISDLLKLLLSKDEIDFLGRSMIAAGLASVLISSVVWDKLFGLLSILLGYLFRILNNKIGGVK